jgi:hypothetical protein
LDRTDDEEIRYRAGTDESQVACFDVSMSPPTVRQIYALAAALCERTGEEFPATRELASEAIERIRAENGHPAPRLPEAAPLRRAGRGTRKLARAIAAEVARELK